MLNSLFALALLLAFFLGSRAANLMHGDYDTDAERISKNWENRELRRMHWKYNPRQRLNRQQLLEYTDPIKRAQHSHPDEPVMMKQDRRGKWRDVYELNGEYVQRRFNAKKEQYLKRKMEFSTQDKQATGLTRSAVYKKRQKEIAREGDPNEIMPFSKSRKGRETMTKGQYLEMLRTYDRGWKRKNMKAFTNTHAIHAESKENGKQSPENGVYHQPSPATSGGSHSPPRHDSPRQSSPSTPVYRPLSGHSPSSTAQNRSRSPRENTPSTPSSSAMSNFIKDINAVENASHSHPAQTAAPAQTPSRSGSLSPTSKFLKHVTNGLF